MVGLVGTIVLQALLSGGLGSPAKALTFSAFFHVVRLFGGQIGATLMGHFIAEHEKLHSFLVGLHVTQAPDRTIAVLAGRVRLQAYALTYIDAFHFVAWTCVIALFLTALLRRLPLNFRDLAAVPAVSSQSSSGE